MDVLKGPLSQVCACIATFLRKILLLYCLKLSAQDPDRYSHNDVYTVIRKAQKIETLNTILAKLLRNAGVALILEILRHCIARRSHPLMTGFAGHTQTVFQRPHISSIRHITSSNMRSRNQRLRANASIRRY